MPESITYNCDCMEYMQALPDNAFDLAVVDPPYGAGFTEGGGCKGWFSKYHQDIQQVDHLHRSRRAAEKERTKSQYKREQVGQEAKKTITWDVAPGAEYFEELFRVSRNQIIWGGNYFPLPPTRCFLVWRKLTISESFTMAMAEYARTSFNDNAKVFEFAPQGKKGDTRFHPTQKPIELYEWVFRLFAKQGDKILDTHLGSGSSRIAAYEAGLDFVGLEIDPVYYELEEQRFEKFVSQRSIFDSDYGAAEQTGLWEDV